MKRCLRLPQLRCTLLRLFLGCCGCLAVLTVCAESTLRVGVLPSAESRLIGELVAESARRAGGLATVKTVAGDARALFAALRSGWIDVYAGDTGALASEIPGLPVAALPSEFERRLNALRFSAGLELGYSVRQGMAMTESRAAAIDIHRLSELRKFFDLRLGLPGPFQRSRSGWQALRDSYELDGMPVVTVDGDAAFGALQQDRVDVILLQVTDPRIRSLGLRVLEDDWAVFREYPAVLVYKKSLQTTSTAAWRGMASLQGRLSEQAVLAMRMAVSGQSGLPAAVVRAWLDSAQAAPMPGLAPAAR